MKNPVWYLMRDWITLQKKSVSTLHREVHLKTVQIAPFALCSATMEYERLAHSSSNLKVINEQEEK